MKVAAGGWHTECLEVVLLESLVLPRTAKHSVSRDGVRKVHILCNQLRCEIHFGLLQLRREVWSFPYGEGLRGAEESTCRYFYPNHNLLLDNKFPLLQLLDSRITQ